jgi:hypothetical protein
MDIDMNMDMEIVDSEKGTQFPEEGVRGTHFSEEGVRGTQFPENTKKIIILLENETNKTKKISCKKEKKMRIETQTWGLTDNDLSCDKQREILRELRAAQLPEKKCRYNSLFTSHIKTKLSSYKQQDVLKKKYNEDSFVNFEDTLHLLCECELKCHYCSCDIYILYEAVREAKQWSLDRINNDIGHNKGNLVIACLECNLKRRRTNKDSFMFTKNLVITREGFQESGCS